MYVTKKIFIINALIVGLLMSVCAWGQAPVYQDLSQPIIVRPTNPSVSVRLPSNPTTGYQWVLMKYDPAVMEKPTSIYQPPNTKLIGAPGYMVWNFKFKTAAFAVPQKTTVILEYKRPWENVPGQPQRITIIIKTK